MQDWIIQRYNKGQDKYYIDAISINDPTQSITLWLKDKDKPKEIGYGWLVLYDFLFNPKWGFAKAFWGGGYSCGHFSEKKDCGYCENVSRNGNNFCPYRLTIDKQRTQEMSISEDPLQYLEQFRGDNEK